MAAIKIVIYLTRMPRLVGGEHHIDSIVVLPEHLHCIWTLPDGDSDFSTRWKKIKARFSSGLPKTEKRSESRIKKEERGMATPLLGTYLAG